MKKINSKIVAIALAMIMALSLSGCSIMGAEVSDLMDFVLHGWDGIYEEKARAEYVAPDPTVRTHEIRENHKATKTQEIRENHKATKTHEIREDHLPTHNNVVTEKYKVTEVNHEVGSTSTNTVASTDTK